MVKKDRLCPKCQVMYYSTDFEFCKYCGGKLEEYSKGQISRGKEKTSAEIKHRTRASWGWKPALVVYAASFILLFIFQNLLGIVGSILGLPILYIPLLGFVESISLSLPYPLFGFLVPQFSSEFLIFTTLGSYGLLVVPFVYLKIKGLSVKELGLDFEDKKEVRNDILVGAFVGGVMVIIPMLVSLVTSLSLGALYSPFDILLSDRFSTIGNAPFMAMYLYQYILLVLGMFLIVAPSEEISTRAFLQQGLENSWGRWIGLIVTAIIFSALHIMLYPQNASGMGFPYYIGQISAILAIPSYLALSLTLGILLQIRKYRIITTITAHALYMIILVSMYYFSNAWISIFF